MANEGAKFLKYGRHTKSQGKPATYKEHIKAKALKKRTSKDGFDGNKRWGNSAIKGVGVNSPAMMEARAKHKK